MAIGAIRGEKKSMDGFQIQNCMLSWLRRASLLLASSESPFFTVCVRFVRMWFVAALLWRFFFAFSVILPSQLPVCGHGGSFDELTVMFVRFLISVPHCIQVQYVVRHWQGILTDYPADFLHYSDNIHSGFRRRVCVAFNLARMA
jgi:hypothetical protein